MAYRILSLDGGGGWAILQAMALDQIYPNKSGHEILAEFDLVAANSGGSIVLGCLVKGMSAREIVRMFESKDARESIFVRRSLWQRWPSLGVRAQYVTREKRKGIANVLGALGETAMSRLPLPSRNGQPVRLLIIGFDYDWRRAAFFRSFETKAGSYASQIPLTDAINAASTAPVRYFDLPAEWQPPEGDATDLLRFWDGGVGGYNNPILAGVVEALIEGTRREDIQALSLGTGTVRKVPCADDRPCRIELKTERETPTLIGDVTKVAEAIIADPPDAATYIAYVVLGHPTDHVKEGRDSGRIVRLNPSVQPIVRSDDSWGAPAALGDDDLIKLMNLDMDAVVQEEMELIENRLGALWIAGEVPNQPVRMRMPNMDCEVGDIRFKIGVGRWQALS